MYVRIPHDDGSIYRNYLRFSFDRTTLFIDLKKYFITNDDFS